MPLQRIVTHRAVKLLQVLLPLCVAVLIAIVVWNVRARQNSPDSGPKPARHFPQDLAVLNEGFSFSQTEGGRTVFTVKAQTNLGFQDQKQLLQNVEVIVHAEREGEVDRRVVSNECSYDAQSRDFRFVGNVIVQLDDKTTARTQELRYNYERRTVNSNLRTEIEQPGAMNGSADNLEYSLSTGVLLLNGNVRVVLQGATLEAGTATFHRFENWANVGNGVRLVSANGWVRGDSGRADLDGETLHPKIVEISGNVSAGSQRAGSADDWKLRSSWLKANITPAGFADHVWTLGDVRVEKNSPAGMQVLTGSDVDASIDESGAVSGIAARQGAQMIFGSDRTLSAETIYSSPEGGVSTEGPSKLQVGDAVVEGRQFSIEQTTTNTTFSTPFRSTLRSAGRESSADRTVALFDSGTNELTELTQTGKFTFKEGTRSGRAESARITQSGKLIALEGSPVVTDDKFQLEAGKISLNQESNSFTAVQNVKSVTQNLSRPVLVTSARADGDQSAVRYQGAVQLWTSDAYIRAERLNASTKDRTFHAEGGVRSDMGAVRATSDTLDYDDASSRAHYIGSVRALKNDLQLESTDMVALVNDGQVSEVTAQGSVVVIQGKRRGSGDRAVYNAKADEVVLTGDQAEVVDPDQGTVRGARLLIAGSGDRVQVQTGTGGRVTSKFKVKR